MTMRIRTGSTPRTLTRIVLLGLSAAALSACGNSLSESLGYGKEAPDEFAIVTKAPLVIPPDYSLRPPRPGAPSPRETAPGALAQTALLGSTTGGQTSGGPSAGELALLSNAGALNADPAVRDLIDDETRALKQKDEKFLDEVLFWQKPSEPNRVVNASGEAQRLRENEALGRPVTDGETPEFDDTEGGGLLDYFFD
ncbi:MAG: DUF3035 domain-containing protein [Parvibaculaceae bacterium]|nr:DUF3035 domain-containing protein [Parvibaculaceae bacterium]HBM89476.1 DUF3035 domain-containing protein [Rhodobiaceae bacterium]